MAVNDQCMLPLDMPAYRKKAEESARQGDAGARGAVFTRREVVEFILDLVGYTSDKPLQEMRLLEPSFGGGDFLFPVVERLLSAWRKSGGTGCAEDALSDAICAVEIHPATFCSTRVALIEFLQHEGITIYSARSLASRWLQRGDFLLLRLEDPFDFVVGNPPYVRQELIPSALLDEYRRHYQTMFDRADLYVPFIERSLSLLKNGGTLGFICADRWMKNRYGGPLRAFVAEYFHVKFYVDMTDTPAFYSNVAAYPAITVICREASGPTQVVRRPAIDDSKLRSLARAMAEPANCDSIRTVPRVTNGSEPWVFDSADRIALIRRLEKIYPSIEDVGCKVGIGVATGADKAFIGPFASLDVEQDRKLPLATTKDIVSGEVHWTGLGVVNPFRADGGLVDLSSYPRLQRYFEERRGIITKRYCVRNDRGKWYRTIDKIVPQLASMPKLLIPDIKGKANVVYEDGRLYPHHNLYFVLSKSWDLRALQAVLLSRVAWLFVATYTTEIRGGFLRFQAQYLRRIHLPRWECVSNGLREELSAAAVGNDVAACNRAAYALFSLTTAERAVLDGIGKR